MNTERIAVAEYVLLSKQMNRVGYGEQWLGLRQQQLAIDKANGFNTSKTVAKLYPSL